ncbi:hypothetical protein DP939_02590 [Spongiactinospora rosea]|uniref:Uncharacterized protein n=1 Tax=Spongiactinospora rosea TaxID=2248750 RepID=A0A366M6D5_9ACTN|nr:hypothetical protein [Spongiactinospora rosea]RBQ21617.1 hypothetical protein DP939_02590 [Spongiactinospora rosea]
MAEPSYVAIGGYVAETGVQAAVPVPPGAAAGMAIVVGMFMDGPPLAVPPTMPPGFEVPENAPVQIPSGAGTHSLYVWIKRLTGSDGGTYTFTWGEERYQESQAILYRDVATTGPLFDSPTDSAADTAAITTSPPVEVTSAGPDRRLVWLSTNWSGGTWTAPTGFTRRVQGGAQIWSAADRSWPTAGATGSVVGSCTGSDRRTAWLGALRGTTSDSTPVAVADAASAGDALAVGATIARGDTATAADTVAVTATAAASDSATAAAALTAAATVATTESGTGADTLAVGGLAPLADAAVCGDGLMVAVTVPLADSVVGGEALLPAVTAPLGDVAAGADLLTAAVQAAMADTAAGADQLARGEQLALGDAATAADALAVLVAAGLDEQAAAVEVLAAAVDVTLTDAAAELDVLAVAGPAATGGFMTATDRRGTAMAGAARAGARMEAR